MSHMQPSPPTFIDLFCGCGGFTLGMLYAGYRCLAAIDFSPSAVTTLRSNLTERPDTRFHPVGHALERDLTNFSPEELAELIGTNQVDVIVGGPPCQGFSTARQVDGSNHGDRLKEDSRRLLYREYLRFVGFFKPKVFVMENVLGIRSAAGGEYHRRVQHEARALGYRVHAKVERASELGVPQKRRRQLFIGTRLDVPGYFSQDLTRPKRAPDSPTLWQAIGDLPRLHAGEGEERRDYDLKLRASFLQKHGGQYLEGVLEVNKAKELTAHRARPHSPRDIGDFKLLREGESSAVAMKRGVEFAFPYDKSSFKDRYTRQHRNRPCSTIVAHLSKDGLMFIHPTQPRSLTPREAARIQSFPDWFEFPVPRTEQFRLIGNAVPPLIGEAVGQAITKHLALAEHFTGDFRLEPLPRDHQEALDWILPLIDASKSGRLRHTPLAEFRRGWYSIAFLHEGLHPDGADCLEGETATASVPHLPDDVSVPRELVSPYYIESGWPKALAPIAAEAWRRVNAGMLTEDELYCHEAQVAGMCYRDPELLTQIKQGRRA